MEVQKHVVVQGPVVRDVGYPPTEGVLRDVGHQLRKSCSQPVPKWQVSGTGSILSLCIYTALLTSVGS